MYLFPDSVAAERKAEEGFLVGIDGLFVGPESEIEGRIAALPVGDVVVAEDLVYGEVLLGEGIGAESGDTEQELRGVEDGHVSEVAFGHGVIADHLREESGLSFSEGIVQLRSEIAV